MSIVTEQSQSHSNHDPEDQRSPLEVVIEHAAHLLPSQGPITSFVHHNTLHAFEDLPFDEGVTTGGRLYGCHAYLPEEAYRREFERERIRRVDLEDVLTHDLGSAGDEVIAGITSRQALRLAMLRFPLRTGSGHELRWMVAETDALRRFRDDAQPSVREQILSETRSWVTQQLEGLPDSLGLLTPSVHEQLRTLRPRDVSRWDDQAWEPVTLSLLWRVCRDGVYAVDRTPPEPSRPLRHRDALLQAGAADPDQIVDSVAIPFCAAFLDQGYAHWPLPDRSAGLFQCFLKLHSTSACAPTRWSAALQRETERLLKAGLTPLQSIEESLRLLEVPSAELEAFITATLLALRGWAGMIRQLETNAEWVPHPASSGSLVEFLAVRLLLDRLAIEHVAREAFGNHASLANVHNLAAQRTRPIDAENADPLAFRIFQLAQVQGWSPPKLHSLDEQQWQDLIREVNAFPSRERRRLFQHAYERRYRNATFDAVLAHAARRSPSSTEHDGDVPRFQVVCCIDDREESFRRHIEECAPDCETFGVAGFFGAAMYYRGVADAHFKPLCPASIKPRHYVTEEPAYSMRADARLRADARRRFGHATHQAHLGSRSFLGGVLTTLAGSLAAFPLVARTLFPWTASRIHRAVSQMVLPASTELHIERISEDASPDDQLHGYSLDEMADIVSGVLRAMGLTQRWSRLIAIIGHGSASLNNPHESAYNCGACSGAPGGPNARAFALMANDLRVRRRLAARGLTIPDDTFFVGGFHDTTNDNVTFADLDRLPLALRSNFEHLRDVVNEARARNADERCRRFESADLHLTPREALRHVEARPEDLSQARPEYNHATNALCFVGRREWSRGLFLDRRAFLSSYDPQQDDEEGTLLAGTLSAVIPVCAGINLEYYFSTVDPEGYGCGSKLPHNIASLLGVMTGAASDLRPGLSTQMIEIHEPVRILFLIETTVDVMQRILARLPAIARLVKGNWVQLAVYDVDQQTLHHYIDGLFVPYAPEANEIPIRSSSMDWYGGSREHLGFASIIPGSQPQPSGTQSTC